MNASTNTANQPIERIVVCGGGLAGHITAAVLARQLPPSIQIVWVRCQDPSDSDVFYGNVTTPSAYAFNLSARVSEPQMILNTSSTFSWGTKFVRWGADNRSWIQCSHLPLPVIGGVLFHHYLAQHDIGEIEPFLTAAMAARHGVFAHPLQKGPPLLARAEYVYQFDPRSYQGPFAAAASESKAQVIAANISTVERDEEGIVALQLSDGRTQTADLYVDCTGPEALLISGLGATFSGQRRLRAAMSVSPAGPSEPCRTLTAYDFGWQSDTPLQGNSARLTVFDPESEVSALLAHGAAPQRTSEATLGRRTDSWLGNCVAVGHAAYVIEPLTHAPMLLLQRDIERLLSLIPVSRDMSVERREFNRQSDEDYVHAEIFNRALFETRPVAETPYWHAARAEPMHEKLVQKIAQFKSRGLLVAFDLEPFSAEDWTILHYGMGRRPARYDRIADRTSQSEMRQFLVSMRLDIENLIKKMPKHGEYVANLIRYLTQQQR